MRSEKRYCYWSHTYDCSEAKHLCCSSCKTKKCDYRCTDDPSDCKYSISYAEASEMEKPSDWISSHKKEGEKEKKLYFNITEAMQDKLKTLKITCKWTLEDMAKIIEVPHNLIQRLLSEKTHNSHMKIVKERYDKIVSFLNNYEELT